MCSVCVCVCACARLFSAKIRWKKVPPVATSDLTVITVIEGNFFDFFRIFPKFSENIQIERSLKNLE